jgi:hypothetical protein
MGATRSAANKIARDKTGSSKRWGEFAHEILEELMNCSLWTPDNRPSKKTRNE